MSHAQPCRELQFPFLYNANIDAEIVAPPYGQFTLPYTLVYALDTPLPHSLHARVYRYLHTHTHTMVQFWHVRKHSKMTKFTSVFRLLLLYEKISQENNIIHFSTERKIMNWKRNIKPPHLILSIYFYSNSKFLHVYFLRNKFWQYSYILNNSTCLLVLCEKNVTKVILNILQFISKKKNICSPFIYKYLSFIYSYFLLLLSSGL